MHLNKNKEQFTSLIQNLTHLNWRKIFLKIIKCSQEILLSIILMERIQICCLRKRVNVPNKKKLLLWKRLQHAEKKFSVDINGLRNEGKMKQAKIIRVNLTNPNKIGLDKQNLVGLTPEEALSLLVEAN